MRKRLYWLAYGVILALAAFAGAEAVAWALTPSWPAYWLRPAPVSHEAVAQWHAGMPEIPYQTNSWLMRDRERSFSKPPEVAFRSLFIGDSFLEGGFTRAALPARIEGWLVDAGHEGVEAINLGVAGTGPVEYYYRTRDIGLKLTPDAVVLTLYSGNDIIAERFPDPPQTPPFLAELPRPSLLGAVAPHLTWQLVNGLRLSGAARGGKYAPNERETIAEALARPQKEGLPILVRMMHQYYFPEVEERRIHEILARGGERFWSEFKPRRFDREYLQGWILYGLISWELDETKRPMSDGEADAAVPAAEISATLSWLVATQKLLQAQNVKFRVAVIPVGSVDPDFVEFWRPWPRYYSYTQQQAARHRAMVAALAKSPVPFIDLAQDLNGARGGYRKTDMHWTERGHELVAARLASEIIALRK